MQKESLFDLLILNIFLTFLVVVIYFLFLFIYGDYCVFYCRLGHGKVARELNKIDWLQGNLLRLGFC